MAAGACRGGSPAALAAGGTSSAPPRPRPPPPACLLLTGYVKAKLGEKKPALQAALEVGCTLPALPPLFWGLPPQCLVGQPGKSAAAAQWAVLDPSPCHPGAPLVAGHPVGRDARDYAEAGLQHSHPASG